MTEARAWPSGYVHTLMSKPWVRKDHHERGPLMLALTDCNKIIRVNDNYPDGCKRCPLCFP